MNIGDFYYVVQIIVQQIFVYLRDLLFNKYYQQADGNDDGHDGSTSYFSLRQFAMDFLAMAFICTFSFLLAIFSSKYSERKTRAFKLNDVDTLSVNHEDDVPGDVDSRRSSETNLHACGDFGHAGNHQCLHQKRASMTDFSRKASCDDDGRPRKAFTRYSQSTQTSEDVFRWIAYNCWLVRRTRSGQIYGKYPL